MIDINIVLQEAPEIVVWWVEIRAVWRPDVGGFVGDQLVSVRQRTEGHLLRRPHHRQFSRYQNETPGAYSA